MINNATNINKANNHLSPEIIGHTMSTTYGIDIKVRVLDKHNHIEGLNRLIRFQPFPLSKGRIDISTQRKTCTDLLYLKKTTFYHKNE